MQVICRAPADQEGHLQKIIAVAVLFLFCFQDNHCLFHFR